VGEHEPRDQRRRLLLYRFVAGMAWVVGICVRPLDLDHWAECTVRVIDDASPRDEESHEGIRASGERKPWIDEA
jgi:hypothetical protein